MGRFVDRKSESSDINDSKSCMVAGMAQGLLYIVDKLAQSERLECVVVHHPVAKRRPFVRYIARKARNLLWDPRERQAAMLRSQLPDFADRHVVDKHAEKRLRVLAEEYGFDLLLTTSVNTDNQVYRYLNHSAARHALVLGGPVLKPVVIDSFNGMWLNCHGGYLPYYRGLWSEYWAIKNGDCDKIGWTIHELVERIDAGEIFQKGTVSYNPDETLEELMLRVHSQMITAYIAFANALPDSAVRARKHKAEKANYYSRPKRLALGRLLRTKVKHL